MPQQKLRRLLGKLLVKVEVWMNYVSKRKISRA